MVLGTSLRFALALAVASALVARTGSSLVGVGLTSWRALLLVLLGHFLWWWTSGELHPGGRRSEHDRPGGTHLHRNHARCRELLLDGVEPPLLWRVPS